MLEGGEIFTGMSAPYEQYSIILKKGHQSVYRF